MRKLPLLPIVTQPDLGKSRKGRKGKIMIRIETKKVVKRGEQRQGITKIDLLKKDELPTLYTQGECVYLGLYGGIVFRDEHGDISRHALEKGILYDKETFQNRIKIIKRCKTRLQTINKALAKANKDWTGSETFVI